MHSCRRKHWKCHCFLARKTMLSPRWATSTWNCHLCVFVCLCCGQKFPYIREYILTLSWDEYVLVNVGKHIRFMFNSNGTRSFQYTKECQLWRQPGLCCSVMSSVWWKWWWTKWKWDISLLFSNRMLTKRFLNLLTKMWRTLFATLNLKAGATSIALHILLREPSALLFIWEQAEGRRLCNRRQHCKTSDLWLNEWKTWKNWRFSVCCRLCSTVLLLKSNIWQFELPKLDLWLLQWW